MQILRAFFIYWDRSLWQDASSWIGGKLINPFCEPFPCTTAFKNIFIGHTPTTNWKHLLLDEFFYFLPIFSFYI